MIRYTIEKRTPVATGITKFYPKIVRAATMPMDDVAALLQMRTTLTQSEVRGFLRSLAQAVQHYVTDSYTVEVEGLGIFTPAIKAKAQNTPDEITAQSITTKGVNYRPTVKMNAKLDQIKFTKANLDTAHL